MNDKSDHDKNYLPKKIDELRGGERVYRVRDYRVKGKIQTEKVMVKVKRVGSSHLFVEGVHFGVEKYNRFTGEKWGQCSVRLEIPKDETKI